jgi:chromosome partitioning protein
MSDSAADLESWPFLAQVHPTGALLEFRFDATELPIASENAPEGQCVRGLRKMAKAGAAGGVIAAQKPDAPHLATTRSAKWLLLASGKGGSGKTTTALNIAASAANGGFKVILVDMDTQETLTHWYNRRPDEAPLLELYTIPLAKAAEAIESVDRQAADTNADLVIVDTPPGIEDHPKESRLLLERADYVLVPTTQGMPDVVSVIEWMGFLRREGIRASFLMNRTQRTYASFREARSTLLKAGPLCPMDVRQLEDIQSTHKFGVGVCEIRKAKGAEDLEGVWHHIRHEMGL